MKNISKILLLLIPIVIISGILALNVLKEPEIEPYYKIGLSGLKERYLVNEEMNVSLFLNGYGSDCGSYQIEIKKGDKQIDGRSIEIECTKEISKDFEDINIDITTFTLILRESGSYTIIAEFSNNNGEKFKEVKNFIVI